MAVNVGDRIAGSPNRPPVEVAGMADYDPAD